MSNTQQAPHNVTSGEACRNRTTRVDARNAFDALTETIWRLRQPDGCPWDREQTHESIAKNLIEEAYEALDCIETDDGIVDNTHLREELGDVLMQVMLHAQIAADEGAFTIADVVQELNDKLVRRHPHVFGAVDADNPDEVLTIWENVKKTEREKRSANEEHPEGLLDSVPVALPALMQAQKVSKKAARAGFEWNTVEDVWEQVDSEHAEFLAEDPHTPERAMEFGDMLFALVNVARLEGIDAEEALRASTRKFRRRWRAMEDEARVASHAIEEYSAEELNKMWNEVKLQERGKSAAAGVS